MYKYQLWLNLFTDARFDNKSHVDHRRETLKKKKKTHAGEKSCSAKAAQPRGSGS